MEIFIEEITRNKKLLHRHRLNQTTVSVGRSYANDIILSDPHTCSNHFSLILTDGLWHIHDHNSVNGTFLDDGTLLKKNRKADLQVINDGDVIVLGKSQLRVLFKAHHVPETVPLSPFESSVDFIRHPVSVFTAIALFMLIAFHSSYLNQLTPFNLSQLFVGAITISLLFLMWPIAVAVVSHFTRNDPRIFAQIGISYTFFTLLWMSDQLERTLVFNAGGGSIVGAVFTLIPIMIIYSLFWLNSYIGFHLSPQRRIIAASSLTILFFGGSYLLQYSKQPEFTPYPQYDATIMPPSFLFSSSKSVDEFLSESEALFELTSEKGSNK